MRVAIMQPYFLPYIGYFQLINYVDKFVVYDNIKFTKKGWIQRNRMLKKDGYELFSLTIKKDSDYLNIIDRELTEDFLIHNGKTLRKIENTYRNAPHFEEVMPLVESIFLYEKHNNLFEFIYNSIKEINKFLNIETKVLISSSLPVNHHLKSQERVIDICKQLKTSIYINPIGGIDLYKKEEFKLQDIELKFLVTGNVNYKQFQDKFEPNLSILDVLMFNSKYEIHNYLNNYELR